MTPEHIEREVLAILATLPAGTEMGTNQLVAAVVGRSDAYDTSEAVTEVYAKLRGLYTKLKKYWREGPPKMNRYKKVIHPKIWFQPTPTICQCPSCGHTWTI